jgi:hypothetical protein
MAGERTTTELVTEVSFGKSTGERLVVFDLSKKKGAEKGRKYS